MLCLVDAADEQPKPQVGNVRVCQSRWVGESSVDYYHGEEGEQDAEAELAEANVGVPGVDLAIAVAVPEEDVLL